MAKLNRKKVVIIVSIIIVLFITIFIIWFINDLKQDQKNTRKVMSKVETLYDNFGDSIDTFNDIRNDLYLNVFDNIYYDTLVQEDESVKKTFLEYENSVTNVTEKASSLKEVCDMAYYPDKDINLKCQQFKNVYEQVINAFKSDIDLYNSTIDNYNSSNTNSLVLEKIKTNIDYIDYNKDGKYEGKEEIA